MDNDFSNNFAKIVVLIIVYSSTIVLTCSNSNHQVINNTITTGTSTNEPTKTLRERECAGYVLFRKTEHSDIRYLLLKPSWDPEEWILPESSMQQGETLRDAAARGIGMTTSITTDDIIDIAMDNPFQAEPSSTYYFVGYVRNLAKQVKLPGDYQDFKWLQFNEACKHADRIGKKVLEEVDAFLRNMGF